jgi:hypothetical protein
LKEYEARLSKINGVTTNNWNELSNNNNDENLLRNTYVNGIPVKKLSSIGFDNMVKENDNLGLNKKKNMHISWAESDKLVSLNYEKELLFQDEIKDITCHMTLKPGKSSIKKNINNNSLKKSTNENTKINNEINTPTTQYKKKLKIRANVDFNKIASEYNNISPNIIKQLIENDSFYFLPNNKNSGNNNTPHMKNKNNKNQNLNSNNNNKIKRPLSFDNNRNKHKLKKESEKNSTKEALKSINNDENNFKSYSLNKNINLLQKKIYNNFNTNDISKSNNYINEQNKIKKIIEESNHINKLLYSLNNKNKMEYLINNFTNYNNSINQESQIKKIYNNFINRNNINNNMFSLTNSTRHSNFIPDINRYRSKNKFLII